MRWPQTLRYHTNNLHETWGNITTFGIHSNELKSKFVCDYDGRRDMSIVCLYTRRDVPLYPIPEHKQVTASPLRIITFTMSVRATGCVVCEETFARNISAYTRFQRVQIFLAFTYMYELCVFVLSLSPAPSPQRRQVAHQYYRHKKVRCTVDNVWLMWVYICIIFRKWTINSRTQPWWLKTESKPKNVC